MKRNTVIILASATLFFGAIGYSPFHLIAKVIEEKDNRLATKGTAHEMNCIRKQSIKRYCKRHGKHAPWIIDSRLWKKDGIYQKPRLYFSDSAKLVYCETPKCGTTQWRNLMLILDGHIRGYAAGNEDNFEMSWEHNFLWSVFNQLTAKGSANIEMRLRKYHKVLTTREPLERLVSAYRNKLEVETDRADAFYVPVSKEIHKKMKPNSTDDGLATFEEFIDYILSTKNPADLDPHWKPYSALCDPCNIEYDFIARMETLYDDIDYIMKNIGIAGNRIFTESPNKDVQKRRIALYHEYFNKIPPSKRTAIFLYFKDQYDMFGYQYPTFIKEYVADL